jgi:predicted double-glycine peptidase
MRYLIAWVTLLLTACSAYTGGATTLAPQQMRDEPGWISVPGVKPLRQKDQNDCGPTALAMVLNYWQPERASEPLAALPRDRQVSAGELRDAARARGLKAFVVEGEPDDLVHELEKGRPVIVGTAKRTVKDAVTHFEVVVGMHRSSKRVATYDPALGIRQNSFMGFLTEWETTGRVLLVIMPEAAAPTANPTANPPANPAAPAPTSPEEPTATEQPAAARRLAAEPPAVVTSR